MTLVLNIIVVKALSHSLVHLLTEARVIQELVKLFLTRLFLLR